MAGPTRRRATILPAPARSWTPTLGRATDGDPAEAPVDITAEEQAWDEAMHQALNIARAEGKVPGQVEETIQGAHTSMLDWRTLLAPLHDGYGEPRL